MINAFKTINENITMVRGDTFAFGVELYAVEDANERPQTAFEQDLDTCYFSVRKDYSDTTNIFQKSLTDGISKVDAGKYRVRIAPEDTEGLEVGNYYYDLEIGINGDYFTLLKGLFEVEYDITQRKTVSRNARLIDFIGDNIGVIEKEEIDGAGIIRNYCFYGCTNLTSIAIPNSVTSIGESAFEGCTNLTSIAIPNSVTKIGNRAFGGCASLININIPNGVTSIGDAAFGGCNALTSISLPNTMAAVNQSLFRNCRNLKEVILPETIIGIGAFAFNNCPNMEEITIKAITPPTITTSTFTGVSADVIIYVPAEAVDAYKAAQYWSARANQIQAIS